MGQKFHDVTWRPQFVQFVPRVWAFCSVEIASPEPKSPLKHCWNEMLMIGADSGCWCHIDWLQGNLQKTQRCYSLSPYDTIWYHLLQQYFGISSPCYPHISMKTCHSTEAFRYRPGITYRGIANYQKCLYLSVTEMDVVPCSSQIWISKMGTPNPPLQFSGVSFWNNQITKMSPRCHHTLSLAAWMVPEWPVYEPSQFIYSHTYAWIWLYMLHCFT